MLLTFFLIHSSQLWLQKSKKKDKQSKLIQCVFCLLALCWSTYAGHGSWEPPRQSQAAGSTAFDPGLNKRYLIIQPHGTLRTWPNGGEIKYRFENDATKKKLLYNLEAALDRWYAASLPEDKFQLTEATAVEFLVRRSSVLLITSNDQGQLSHHARGCPAKDDPRSELQRPDHDPERPHRTSACSTSSPTTRTKLGHAWGLLHEHQTPQFCADPYGQHGRLQPLPLQLPRLERLRRGRRAPLGRGPGRSV